MRYLLGKLKLELLNHLPVKPDHHARLHGIIDANFSGVQRSKRVAITWMVFWTQSMHTPQLARLQKINAKRLISNLKYSLSFLITSKKVEWCAQLIAAQIDGYWLRSALSHEGEEAYEITVTTCKELIDHLVKDHSL